MSSSALQTNDRKSTAPIETSPPSKKLRFDTNDESKVSNNKTTTSILTKSTTSGDRTIVATATTAITPIKLPIENALLTDTEEKNTSPAPSSNNNTQTIASKTGVDAIKMNNKKDIKNSIDENQCKMSSGNDTIGKNRNSGRPIKKSTSPSASVPTSTANLLTCAWCNENKPILKYVLPIPGADKEFCSELCISEFRKARKKGACNQCGNVIRPNVAPNTEFCSTFCFNKSQNRRNSDGVSSTTNNNVVTEKNNKRLSTMANSYLQIFDWDEYLKVS